MRPGTGADPAVRRLLHRSARPALCRASPGDPGRPSGVWPGAGYEDLNDHDELRKDPALQVLAGKSTLNRIEHTPKRHGAKYHKIDCDRAKVDTLLVDLFLEAHDRAPRQIVLDLDATHIPLHGRQEGRFFHGYYDAYCYLPLYIFSGRHLLLARQRRANLDAASGAVKEMARIVAQIRGRCQGPSSSCAPTQGSPARR